jgi:hypothetical protein
VRVLCIDPGPHTGVAWYDSDAGSFAAYEAAPEDVWDCFETKWLRWADVVVVEDFIIGGARAKEANVTIEMIGVMRYLCKRESVTFVTQPPGAHKFAQGDKLKRLGWYTVGSDHARSATGHLVRFLVERGLLDGASLLPSDSEKEEK